MAKKRARRKESVNPTKQKLIDSFSQSPAPNLIKHLASTNPSVRNLSLRLLESWLTSIKPSANVATAEISPANPTGLVSDEEMKKLWKGLFYCLWHCDKAVNQANLINRLSSLLVSLDPSLGLQYFSNFLLTLRREWPGIDHLRLDKFYLLIRKFFKSMFIRLKNCKWDLAYLEKFVEILINNAFLADDKLLGNGVCYHVASVFLDELRGCSVWVEKQVVDMLFKPFFSVLCSSLDKILVVKVKSCVFEELLNTGKSFLEARKNGGAEGSEVGYDDAAFAVIAMKMGFAGKLYELGSRSDCIQGNRKVLFGLQEEYLKLEKEFESSGIVINIPEVADTDEVIPELIPIDNFKKNEVGINGTVVASHGEPQESEDLLEDEDEKLRKRKKAKKGKKEKNCEAKKKNGKKAMALDEKMSDEVSADVVENGSVITCNGNGSASEPESNGNLLNESVIANLQMQFEKVAAELGSDDEDTNLSNVLVCLNNGKSSKKRKKVKTTDREEPGSPLLSTEVTGVLDASKSIDKSGKKVRFAMKNNLVWKPHSPLPPQSLRLPPSATPRGSALKKGVPPGPIREIPPAKKKLKQKKKVRKILNTISPAMKRFQKL